MTPHWIYLGFFTAIGACVGSFLNVVIYRLPAGKSLVHPPSTCPKCNTRLAWYDNVPVLGWFWLRGKCRTCKLPIAFQYPVVEAVTAALFAAAYVLFYVLPINGNYNSRFDADLAGTWPTFVVYLVLIGGLVAATMIDARLYIIPLQIPRLVALVALVALPLAAIWLPDTASPSVFIDGDITNQLSPDRGWWTITTPSPVVDGAAVAVAGGALVGLIIANLLLLKGILPLSFPSELEQSVDDPAKASDAVPPAQETKKERKARKNKEARAAAAAKAAKKGPPRGVMLVLVLTIAIVICVSIGSPLALAIALCLLWWGMLLHGAVDEQAEEDAKDEEGPDEWLAHPSPRREVLKECLFVAFPIVGGVVGSFIWRAATANHNVVLPDAVRVAAGVVMGFLVGGGFVWFIRIAGTLGFGKEAMGLGDVHLMAAVGAVIGGMDAAIATLLAAFMGILHTALVMGVVGLFKKRQSAIPFGPHLCGAVLMMVLLRDPIAHVLYLITGMRIG